MECATSVRLHVPYEALRVGMLRNFPSNRVERTFGSTLSFSKRSRPFLHQGCRLQRCKYPLLLLCAVDEGSASLGLMVVSLQGALGSA